jgi:tetratricopeptide (TPR) repeat protein
VGGFGVIVGDPRRFGPDRLTATPISAVAADGAFANALTGAPDRPLLLAPVEAAGVLRDAYRPLPARYAPAGEGRAPSFSVLLRSEFRVVPFRERARELEQLGAWCTTGSGLAVAVLVGAAGTGKTRLATELCHHQQAAAVAGFLEPAAAADSVARLAGGRLLVVVDEAHSRTEQLAELLNRLVAVQSAAPIRLLLLSRQLGDWWQGRLDELLDDEARDARDAARIVELGAVDRSVEGRRAAFKAAARAFARTLGRRVGEFPAPDLSGPAFAPILFVHLAALSALEGETAVLEGEVVRRDLVDVALVREARYWRDTAGARKPKLELDREVRKRAVALASVTVAASEDEAATALAAIPDLADATELLRPTARWLRDLYPGPIDEGRDNAQRRGWFRPLAPPLLVEALVADVVADLPSLPTRLLERATPAQAHAALTALTQTARTPHSAAREPLRKALAAHLPSLWATTITVAQETGDPLGSLAADVLEQTPNPELAAEIERSLPEHTLALRELAVVATGQTLERARDQPASLERDASVAQLLNNLSNRLADLGRREPALAASDEAVEPYRRLAEQRPDAFLPDLAMSLNNLSNQLANLGRREPALAAIDEAVELYRRLAEVRPDAFLPDLASSLNNLSSSLADLGRREPALAAIDEAIRLVLPMLERAPYVLPDSGLRLAQRYLELCEQAGREPDEKTLQRMHAVLVSAGVLVPEEEEQPAAHELERHLAWWEPVFSALVAARGGDRDAAKILDEALTTRGERDDWKQLAVVLRRLAAGEQAPDLLAGLDAINTAIAQRALDALNGRTQVDPEAWQTLAAIPRAERLEDVSDALAQLAAGVVSAVRGDQQVAEALERILADMEASEDWTALAGVLRRILAGERDPTLVAGLDETDTAVVSDVLVKLADR